MASSAELYTGSVKIVHNSLWTIEASYQRLSGALSKVIHHILWNNCGKLLWIVVNGLTIINDFATRNVVFLNVVFIFHNYSVQFVLLMPRRVTKKRIF